MSPNEQTALLWWTGHRVEVSGTYVNQYGRESTHYRHGTFPPAIGEGGCAYYTLIQPLADH